MVFHKMLLIVPILLSVVYKSSAIQCFYCTSANNTACIDPSQYDPETRARVIPIVDCGATGVLGPQNIDFFCRKIVQTIFHRHHEAEVRVTRSCGWIRQEKPCYRVSSHDHLETACQCFSDYCNSANSVVPTATALSVALAACLYLYR